MMLQVVGMSIAGPVRLRKMFLMSKADWSLGYVSAIDSYKPQLSVNSDCHWALHTDKRCAWDVLRAFLIS